MAKWLSQLVQVGLPINSFKTAASLVESYRFEEEVGNSLVVREPIGVVGCITPWNYPLHQIAAKVAYAMAAGCTVVLKPSEVAPIDAFMLAEVIDEVGLPAGVFNLVSGLGPGGRRGDRRPPGRRHGVVHRLDARRQARRPARRRDGEEGRSRARRQVGQRVARRPRQRRLRQGRGRRRAEGVPQLRPDVLRADPHARARRPPRRSRAGRRRRRREGPCRRPVHRGGPPRPAGVGGPARSGAGLHQEGHRGRGDARRRRTRRARGPGAPASTCDRPCSPTCSRT